ncbi:phosphoribosyltransferase [Methanoculleus sp. YWC-01]|jgi:predicted phosphoribosyltransferase|uniref:Phosphoribosyltransferase n=1 Tax=Methanoculleus nereidis TaxID=2735141 RepID=A0ABU3Z0H2_9EURY|nr:phosphoribosyltransferase family protein [Methanoculleus sp. YWC-01]MCK9298200.1 phosphoribosyltransferase [Methanoculleus sp.]MDV4342085.1 phosphoribosyltransferase [Methanoculleus sp. YWC-01]PKL55111.1 MAG: phosphoribosyltransferase [Methanomicrobiales archaeon HGW-Methanomicrobiales-6]
MLDTGRIIEDRSLRDRLSVFENRTDAGRQLAAPLSTLETIAEPVICAIPAGGVPPGLEVARALKAPLRMAVVRKVQVPWDPEAGFGAVTWNGRVFLNRSLMTGLDLSEAEVNAAIAKARKNVAERIEKFASGREEPEIEGQDAILIDDGLATGYTMFAAIEAARAGSPRQVVVAVPTGSLHAVNFIARQADLVICLNVRTSRTFAVAQAYEQWHDVTDQEVQELLIQARDMGLL